MKKISIFIFILYAFIFAQEKNTISVSYDDFPKIINIPTPTKKLKEKYNKNAKSEFTEITKGEFTFSGYRTDNSSFLNEVLLPELRKNLPKLKSMNKFDAINAITLFTHEMFRIYFTNDFYRWGGDILDLDDPQSEGIRYQYKYGLDCSGFAAMPYEIAVILGILDPNSEEAVFSSKGYKNYCEKTGKSDRGGLKGTSNNFRLDTSELFELGELIFEVPKGGEPTEEQLKLLKPGDLIGRDGHVGIIVYINNQPYFLESGGWVVPKNNGLPCRAKESLKIFAKSGVVQVRRSISDK